MASAARRDPHEKRVNPRESRVDSRITPASLVRQFAARVTAVRVARVTAGICEQRKIGEGIRQGRHAFFTDRQLSLKEVAPLDGALESSVCRALAGHRLDAAGATV